MSALSLNLKFSTSKFPHYNSRHTFSPSAWDPAKIRWYKPHRIFWSFISDMQTKKSLYPQLFEQLHECWLIRTKNISLKYLHCVGVVVVFVKVIHPHLIEKEGSFHVHTQSDSHLQKKADAIKLFIKHWMRYRQETERTKKVKKMVA